MTRPRILVTGSAGLVGRCLRACMENGGFIVHGFDNALPAGNAEHSDIRDVESLTEAAGVIHLAAIAHVKEGERDPATCHSINVGGTRSVVAAVERLPSRPCLIFASSREVHGEPDRIPVAEDALIRPCNVYGRSKAEGEQVVLAARQRGHSIGIVRLTNAYGSAGDHPDRVVPAFCRAAARGETLLLEGERKIFDFLHSSDVARALILMAELLAAGHDELPPILLGSGMGVSLEELAELAISFGDANAKMRRVGNPDAMVSRFVADPTRAAELIGWRAERSLRDGIESLVGDFSAEAANLCPTTSHHHLPRASSDLSS